MPSTDSLYLLAIVWFFVALKTESFIALLLSSILGILAKEAFFMFLPLLFFVKQVSVLKKLGVVALTIMTYVLVRFVINALVPEANMEKGILNALSHIDSFNVALVRIFSVQGILEIGSVFTW